LPAVASKFDNHDDVVAAEQSYVKEIFLGIFLIVLTCIQGIRIADVPVPFALFVGIFYVCVFRPPIPAAAPRIYAIIISYLLIVSARNALSDSGSLRDFLYIGICFTNIAVTIALFDLFQTAGARKIGIALMAVALFEVALQILEYFNMGDFNNLMAPVLEYWAAQTNSQSFLSAPQMAIRAPGTLGAPTVAGLAIYLVIRGAAIVLRRRRLIYLSIIPIIIGGARTALVVFLLWEVVAQSISYGRRNAAKAARGLFFLFIVTAPFLAFPQLSSRVFLFRSFAVSPTEFSRGFSVVNRLRSIEWAIQHWQQVVTFGGVTSSELASRISWQGSGVDSEIVLRSLQFGFVGFLCLLASTVWTGFYWRNPDSWFVVCFVMIASLTNAMLSNFVSFPFVIVYCLCVHIDRVGRPNARETAQPTVVIPESRTGGTA
jgi:hypothetical protein